jgi:hypothetical protein
VIASFYGRLFFGGGGAEDDLGAGVNSHISDNLSALSLIESIVGAQSSINVLIDVSSTIKLESGYLSAVSPYSDTASNFNFDYKGRISGFSSEGAALESKVNMTEAIQSTIDVTPINAMSIINSSSGRISAISDISDILSTIDANAQSVSSIGNTATGIMSVLR